jgi:hypothetical protein
MLYCTGLRDGLFGSTLSCLSLNACYVEDRRGVLGLESAGNVGIFNPFCFVIHTFEIEGKTSWRCKLSMIDSV